MSTEELVSVSGVGSRAAALTEVEAKEKAEVALGGGGSSDTTVGVSGSTTGEGVW